MAHLIRSHRSPGAWSHVAALCLCALVAAVLAFFGGIEQARAVPSFAREHKTSRVGFRRLPLPGKDGQRLLPAQGAYASAQSATVGAPGGTSMTEAGRSFADRMGVRMPVESASIRLRPSGASVTVALHLHRGG